MRRITRLAVGAIAIAASAPAALAQDAAQNEGFFGKPAFVLMPGAVIAPVLSGPAGLSVDEAGGTEAYFNARFMTVVPTKFPWFQLLAGAQWQPNGPSAGGVRLTQPAIFYGAIFPIAPLTELTGGWFSASIDPLGVYGLGLGGTDRDLYGHDFFLEAALVANVGQKMMSNMGFFSSTSLFLLLDQQITHVSEDANGDKDYWSPILITGITIPVGR